MNKLKYPIGKFEHGKEYTSQQDQQHILDIERFPARLRLLVNVLHPSQLAKSYRPNGWTGRQIIHHIADSHLNAYVRTKLALTETSPTIKPYGQDLWANLPDGKMENIEVSLQLIESVHHKWVYLLKTLTEKDFQKRYIHPEYGREFKLSELLALYVWHGNQHYEYLKIIKDQSAYDKE